MNKINDTNYQIEESDIFDFLASQESATRFNILDNTWVTACIASKFASGNNIEFDMKGVSYSRVELIKTAVGRITFHIPKTYEQWNIDQTGINYVISVRDIITTYKQYVK